ncbi:MAG: FtsX-like permease family protein [Chitinivibrionales bacterium]|nr:FtsX-like permease family protein [Chitinivibrionales bacterium]MBD3359017.1 FtsX-like permease family protein [Chitinivibrionales bacterium]
MSTKGYSRSVIFVRPFGSDSMPAFKIAFRNALRQRRRTILTLLTMLGGYALASISIGWADGTYNTIIDIFTRNRLGHVQIHAAGYLDKPSLYKKIADYRRIGKVLSGIPGVEAWAPRLKAAGLVSVGDNSSAASITGIDPGLENAATRFSHKIAAGKMLEDAGGGTVLAGKGLAKVLEAEIGDTLVIVSRAADGSIANDLYTIRGIVESGNSLEDRSSLYMHLDEAQELFALYGSVHEIAVVAERSGTARALAAKIIDALPPEKELAVAPWQEFARSFHTAMQADKQGMYIFLFVIMLIVAVGVLNTVLMAVLERRREYGLLKAVGTRPGRLFWLILIESVIIAIAAIIGGIGVGLMGNWLLSVYGIQLPQPISYGGMEIRSLHAEINFRTIYIPAVVVLATAALVSIFPALQAARVDPAHAMRTH